MNARLIYTRKFKGLDNAVWLFIIIVMLLSLILLTSFLIGRTKCIPFKVAVTPYSDSVYYTGKTIYFSSSVSAKHITWDFGDGTPGVQSVSASHQFHKEGKYYVSANMKEDCEQGITIIVKKNPYDHTSGNEIKGPEMIEAGKEAEFNCLVYGNTWSWEVIDHPEIKAYNDKTGNEKLGSIKFRFTKGGTYYVQVTLDDDRTKSYRKEVFVNDGKVKPATTIITPPPVEIKRLINDNKKPTEKEEAVEKVKTLTVIRYIKEGTFKDYLNQVIADDNFSPILQDFDQYLFKKGETPVKINGGSQMSFKKFYDYLKTKGNMAVTSVVLQRNQEDKSKVDFIVVTIGSK
ncbi:MAG: hypothetical protein JNM14_07735 [Ferruginibacter sp.]|nr:hypothetical protein [Ferruginibacter sp.]